MTTVRLALRTIAIVIAVAAMIDPAWSRTQPADRRLVAIVAAAESAPVDRLRAHAAGWQVVARPANGSELPCAPDERCVVIADGSVDLAVARDLQHPVALIVDTPVASPNVEVRRAVVGTTHASAAGSARVDLVRRGTVAATDIRISDAGAVVGSATYKWGNGDNASVDVPWWPIQAGARLLRIEAMPVEGERTTIDNAIDVGVDVASSRVPVLVFDARPSWISTFVRRALEDDPRFTVTYAGRVAPQLTAGTAGARFTAAALEEAGAVIVGGPDALTGSDVRLLEQYVRERGGSLVLLPEQRADGPAARLFAGAWTEHLTATPERIGPLLATEVLRSTDVPLATVLGRSGTQAAIVSTPNGNGRVIVSGAMDAWRHRDADDGSFDRFWRSLVAEAAFDGAPLTLTISDSLAAAGTRTRFTIRQRRMTPAAGAEASAVMRCGDHPPSALRLWPSGPIGEFTGEAAATNQSCTIEAVVDGRQVTAALAVAEQPRRGTTATLARLITAVGGTSGTVVDAGDEAAVIHAFDRDRQPSSQVVSSRPMRSSWWMIPFAACLSAEWWLRRRDGLR
jgi:hypothetical protein